MVKKGVDNEMMIQFGGTHEEQSELANLVEIGEKTATSSLVEIKQEEDLTQIGDIWEIHDGKNHFICFVEVENVVFKKFSEVDEEFALLEGDGSLKNWTQIHHSYYSFLLEKIGKQLSSETLLECVYFKKTDKKG